MILSALYEYYQRMVNDESSGIPTPGYTNQQLTHIVEISEQGLLERVILLGDSGKSGSTGQRVMVPWTLEAACRKSNIAAYVLVDKAKYALGIEGHTLTPEHGRAFRSIVEELGAQTQDLGILAVQRFLQVWNPRKALEWDDKGAITSGIIAFKLHGDSCLVHEREAFRKYWKDNWLNWRRGKFKVKAKCLVTGCEQNIARIHQPLKEVKDSQSTGAALVSFNKDAFSSYGKEQNYNAPVGEEAAFAYTTALNHLLHKENGHCVQIGDATTVFWADVPRAEAVLHLLIAPEAADQVAASGEEFRDADGLNSQEVLEMLTAFSNGESEPLPFCNKALLETQCHILGLQANKARLAVRFWHCGRLGELVHTVGRHYAVLAIERQYDFQPRLPSIRQLLCAAASHQIRKKPHFNEFDTIPPILGGALVRSILTGTCYPKSLFSTVLSRIRTDRQVTYLRAAALKACLLRNYPEVAGNIHISLDEGRTDVPYLLGRLFAIVEKKQQGAMGIEIGGAFRDRYFNIASTSPSRIFPELLRLSRQRVKSVAFANAHAKKIRDVMLFIDSFPARLTLQEQGVFNIAYYHQKNVYYRTSNEEPLHGHH